MKQLFIFLPLLVLPVVGLTLASRWIWTTVLGILAGLGLASAKQADDASTQPEGSMHTCYKPAMNRALLYGTPWKYIPEMESWAMSEHAIIDMVKGKDRASLQYDDLQKLITAAEQAGKSVKSVVDRKELRLETYTMTMEVLNNWHRDVALSTTSVRCYDTAASPPYIDDVNAKLMSLNKLAAERALSEEVLTQAKAGIEERVVKETKPDVAEEVSLLLVSLLYN